MAIQVGTSHFVSLGHAAQYYSFYYGNNLDNGRVAAKHKITTGEIHIGPPELKPGETLQIIDDGTRYAIIEAGTDGIVKSVLLDEKPLPEDRLRAIKVYCEDIKSDFPDANTQATMNNILILAGFGDQK